MNKPAKALAERAITLARIRARPVSPAELNALADLAREVLEPKRRGPAKVVAVGRMKPDRKTKAEARRSTRPLVEARENGRCAVAHLGGCSGRLVWDHFFGRGKVPPSVELEWMLCEKHNHEKTENEPDRLAWLYRFSGHASRHIYRDALDRADRAIAIELAQHPEARKAATT